MLIPLEEIFFELKHKKTGHKILFPTAFVFLITMPLCYHERRISLPLWMVRLSWYLLISTINPAGVIRLCASLFVTR
ncbi:hypothetical protein ABF86_02570 [Nitrosomonas sp. GH22]|nr:hypothetical protein [Nitrosomonas sp. GH22]